MRAWEPEIRDSATGYWIASTSQEEPRPTSWLSSIDTGTLKYGLPGKLTDSSIRSYRELDRVVDQS